MDRLLRLLSKKHSAFKPFARDFSKAIFINDQTDFTMVGKYYAKKACLWNML